MGTLLTWLAAVARERLTAKLQAVQAKLGKQRQAIKATEQSIAERSWRKDDYPA